MVEECHAKLSKATSITVDPLSCVFSFDLHSLRSLAPNINKLFKKSPFLHSKYTSVQDFWSKLILIKISQCQELVVAFMKDYWLIVFNLSKENVNYIELPIVRSIMLCDISVLKNEVIIGALEQVLCIDWEKRILWGVDYSIFNEVKYISMQLDVKRQQKLMAIWKNRVNVSRTDYAGDFKGIATSNGHIVKGIIGVLYTKYEFESIRKETRTTQDNKGILAQLELETAPYIFYFSNITYVNKEFFEISKKYVEVEYFAQQNESKSCLMLRMNNKGNMSIVALNSPQKFYCQLFIFAVDAKPSMNLRPVNFLSKNDILPDDKEGITSMLILDMQWTPNDHFVIIAFCSNYFCVLSPLGQPINLVQNNVVSHFCVIPKADSNEVAYKNLRVTNSSICLFSNTLATTVNFEPIISLTNLWKPGNDYSSVNRVLKLILNFPELSASSEMLDVIEKVLNDEVIYFTQQIKRTQNLCSSRERNKSGIKDIARNVSREIVQEVYYSKGPNTKVRNDSFANEITQNLPRTTSSDAAKNLSRELNLDLVDQSTELIELKNPFPIEPIGKLRDVIKGGYLLIEGVRWTNDIPNNILELLQNELENAYQLLYLKNEPICFLYIFDIYRKIVYSRTLKTINRNLRFYSVAKSIQELINESQIESFQFGKKKVLLMLYCLIQFRNPKATCLNVLYIVLAGVLNSEWGKQKTFMKEIKSMIYILKSNLFPYRCSHGRSDLKANFRFTDEGTFYQAMLKLCNKVFQKTIEKNTYEKLKLSQNKSTTNKKNVSKEDMSVILLKLYDSTIMNEVLSTVNCNSESLTDRIMSIDYMGELFSCLDLMKRGKFSIALSQVKRSVVNASSSLAWIFVFTNLSVIALTLLQGKCKYTIKFNEGHTFLYRILSGISITKTFEQLKIPVDNPIVDIKVLESLSIDCLNEDKLVYAEVGIMLQISECAAAIDILSTHSNPSCILLSFIILNNKLNESFAIENMEKIKEYLKLIFDNTKTLAHKYISIITRLVAKEMEADYSLYMNLFSTCIALSSKIMGSVIVYTVLPLLVSKLYWLLQITDMPSDIIIQSHNKFYSGVQASPFMLSLSSALCNSPESTCKKFFASFFINSYQATLFNALLQESAQILSACLRSGIITFLPTKSITGDFFKVTTTIPKCMTHEIQETVSKCLKLVWEVSLLLLIQELKDDSTQLSKLKLAGCIIRLSFTLSNVQQELEFIKQGLAILKSVDYASIDAVNSKSDIETLGNAFDIYTEKWASIIKDEKQVILKTAKETNLAVFTILNEHIIKKRPVVFFNNFTKNFQENPVNDTFFCKLLKTLGKILVAVGSENNPLLNSIKRGEKIKMNLRQALENIKEITAIPNNAILFHENNEWVLKLTEIFCEANDEFNEYSNKMEIISNVFNTLFSKESSQERYHRNAISSIIGTWRATNRKTNMTVRQFVRKVEKRFIKRKLFNSKKSEDSINFSQILEEILYKERAIAKIIGSISKHLCKDLKEMGKTNSFHMKKKVSTLVPIYLKSLDHQKSLSFTVHGTESVKPFVFYAINKEKLSKPKLSRQPGLSQSKALTTEQYFTTDLSQNESFKFSYFGSTMNDMRSTKKQKPFSLIRVPVHGSSLSKTKHMISAKHHVERMNRTCSSHEIKEAWNKLDKINKEHNKIKAKVNMHNTIKVPIRFMKKIS